MSKPSVSSTERFSDRVEHYASYRPTYPGAVVDLLKDQCGLHPGHVIADIGSGTGLSSQLFLEKGHPVFGVEPNLAMRLAAERLLKNDPNFHSVAGTAEQTTLPKNSINFVVAGQAFHWFDEMAFRKETLRITGEDSWAVLLWNSRQLDTTPFLRDFEALILEFGTDYQQVRHDRIDQEKIRRFFGGPLAHDTLPNEQILDWQGAQGRLLSSSYVPGPDEPGYAPMLQRMEDIFNAHAQNGKVRFLYDTEMYYGMLEP